MAFDRAVIDAVTAHMNGDHVEDNVLIARAFGFPGAETATMVDLDETSGLWLVRDADGEHDLRVPWPSGRIAERPQVRKEVVLLYRAACEALGVPMRVEHAAPAHLSSHPDRAPHPHGARQSVAPVSDGDDAGFARRIRTATWIDHGESEGETFMSDLLRGRGTLDDYIRLTAQHFFMYDALEDAAGRTLHGSFATLLHPVALHRRAALERDLEHLLGAGWRSAIAPVNATAAYAARIREIAEQGWVAGVIAHHYTRYLGDLSGGQIIARRVAKQFGFVDGGVSFYDFTELGDLSAFKDRYRERLDVFGVSLTGEEQERMLAEVRAAYRYNTAVFVDLGRDRIAA